MENQGPTTSALRPYLDKHNDEIYGELGLTHEELSALRSDGVI